MYLICTLVCIGLVVLLFIIGSNWISLIICACQITHIVCNMVLIILLAVSWWLLLLVRIIIWLTALCIILVGGVLLRVCWGFRVIRRLVWTALEWVRQVFANRINWLFSVLLWFWLIFTGHLRVTVGNMLECSSLSLLWLILVFIILVLIIIWRNWITIFTFQTWIAIYWILIFNRLLSLRSIARLLSFLLILSLANNISVLLINNSFVSSVQCSFLLWTFVCSVKWFNRLCTCCFLLLNNFFESAFSDFPFLLITFFLILSWNNFCSRAWLCFPIQLNNIIAEKIEPNLFLFIESKLLIL